ncbi:hypothetical protein Tco_0154903 [Tanacetum coccineum]
MLQSTTSHSITSNFGNQFINSPNASLISTIPENAEAEINSLLDIQIQQDVPNIQVSDLEKDVKVLKQVDHTPVILESIKSEVPESVNKYLGSTLGDTLQKRKRRHDDKDQDLSAGSDQGIKKRRTRKDVEPLKKSLKSKESAKGSISKIPKKDRFKKSPRPKTLNPDWNTVKTINDAPEQPWLYEMMQAEKSPLMFDKLMSTPIDFFAFSMNHLKLNKITRSDLVGLVLNLLKGTYKSCVELEYNMKECYHALIDQLDWANPEGHKIPVDMSKPVPLQDK